MSLSKVDDENIADNTDITSNALFLGDCGELPLDTRRTLVQLLSGPSLEERRHSKLWSVLLRDEVVISSYPRRKHTVSAQLFQKRILLKIWRCMIKQRIQIKPVLKNVFMHQLKK